MSCFWGVAQEILVIDFHGTQSQALINALEIAGLDPYATSNADKALNLVEEHDFCALLLSVASDDRLRGLVSAVRKQSGYEGTPIFFFGFGRASDPIKGASDALFYGGDYYFRIPCDLEYLAHRICTWVGATPKPSKSPTQPAVSFERVQQLVLEQSIREEQEQTKEEEEWTWISQKAELPTNDTDNTQNQPAAEPTQSSNKDVNDYHWDEATIVASTKEVKTILSEQVQSPTLSTLKAISIPAVEETFRATTPKPAPLPLQKLKPDTWQKLTYVYSEEQRRNSERLSQLPYVTSELEEQLEVTQELGIDRSLLPIALPKNANVGPMASVKPEEINAWIQKAPKVQELTSWGDHIPGEQKKLESNPTIIRQRTYKAKTRSILDSITPKHISTSSDAEPQKPKRKEKQKVTTAINPKSMTPQKGIVHHVGEVVEILCLARSQRATGHLKLGNITLVLVHGTPCGLFGYPAVRSLVSLLRRSHQITEDIAQKWQYNHTQIPREVARSLLLQGHLNSQQEYLYLSQHLHNGMGQALRYRGSWSFDNPSSAINIRNLVAVHNELKDWLIELLPNCVNETELWMALNLNKDTIQPLAGLEYLTRPNEEQLFSLLDGNRSLLEAAQIAGTPSSYAASWALVWLYLGLAKKVRPIHHNNEYEEPQLIDALDFSEPEALPRVSDLTIDYGPEDADQSITPTDISQELELFYNRKQLSANNISQALLHQNFVQRQIDDEPVLGQIMNELLQNMSKAQSVLNKSTRLRGLYGKYKQ